MLFDAHLQIALHLRVSELGPLPRLCLGRLDDGRGFQVLLGLVGDRHGGELGGSLKLSA